MKYSCYILYSKEINRYYVGYTSDIEERIGLHNNGYFGSRSYTSKATDWVLFILIPCDTIEHSIFIESKIKKMKSRKYYENLKKYPDIIVKILNEYSQ